MSAVKVADDEQALAAAIGTRVKAHRTRRSLTLDQLAEYAAVSRRLLVSIEHGEGNPSVGTLLKIASALGVGLPTLVDPAPTGPLSVTRAGGGAVLWNGANGGTGTLVASVADPAVVELWEWVLQPGESYASGAHPAGTRELIHVHQGSVAVSCGNDRATLKRGDAVAFAGDVEHVYANAGSTVARFSLSVYEPATRRARS